MIATAASAPYRTSQVHRKRIEEVFAWVKTVAGLSKTRHQGLARVDWQFTLALAAYDLIRIEDEDAVLPLDASIQSNLREATTRVLASLTPREERILRMRFGIGMNTDHTLDEVGQQFSVTRERIRQIQAMALRKLKHPSRSRRLRSFLDN